LTSLFAETSARFVNINVPSWAWIGTICLILGLLLFDILVLHRTPKVPPVRRAAIETVAWAMVGIAFGIGVIAKFGNAAGGEYFSGFLIEYSLSIDNVFVWALILSFFKVPAQYQHRVLFWGIFGALVLRAGFIFAGVAIIERFEIMLVVFGVFLLYTAAKLIVSEDDAVDPSDSKFLRLVRKFVPSTEEFDGQKLFTRVNGKRFATPLFGVLLLVEITDVLFAVDSVPAVLAVSKEQFIVFTSNAFAIMGLRSLYFLLADMHARFSYLQQGLAVILAFVGIKMIVEYFGWLHISSGLSLLFIALILISAVAFSLKKTKGSGDEIHLADDSASPPHNR
jgi:tellurite resistance protein TerC